MRCHWFTEIGARIAWLECLYDMIFESISVQYAKDALSVLLRMQYVREEAPKLVLVLVKDVLCGGEGSVDACSGTHRPNAGAAHASYNLLPSSLLLDACFLFLMFGSACAHACPAQTHAAAR